MRKYSEINNNINKICQNIWDAAKEVLGGKFRTFNAYIS